MLAKGAIGFVLPAGTLFLFLWRERRVRWMFRPDWLVVGLGLVTGLGFSWYLALGVKEGWSFMRELFLEHHVERFLGAKQGHGGPFFYYVPVLLVGFLPWSAFLVPSVRHGNLRHRDDEASRYVRWFLWFSGLTFLFFSLAATKLPNYLAPVLPGVSLLVARVLAAPPPREALERRLWTWPMRALVGLLLLLGAVLIALPWVLAQAPALLGEKAAKVPGLSEPMGWSFEAPLAGLSLVTGAVLAASAWRRRDLGATWRAASGGFVAFLLITSVLVLPRYDRHFLEPLRESCRRAGQLTDPDERIVVSMRNRPSVSFYSGRRTEYCRRRDEERVHEIFARGEVRYGIFTEDDFGRIQDEAPLEVLERRGGIVLFRSLGADETSSPR
jgi:4-amino-4-deoxy-L-arabinose transferase-like glycosyltransferase